MASRVGLGLRECPQPNIIGLAMPEKKPKPNYLTQMVDALSRMEGIPPFVREHYFAAGRAWAFDIAWPDFMMAVEYEGNTWVGGYSRHTTGMGYRLDVTKYNEAASLGWCVIRITSDMVRDFSYIDVIVTALLVRIAEAYDE